MKEKMEGMKVASCFDISQKNLYKLRLTLIIIEENLETLYNVELGRSVGCNDFRHTNR